jgi:LPXTG-site transpeptidase (sortase) family protein
MKRKVQTIFIIIFSFISLGVFVIFIIQKVYYAPTDEVTLPPEIEKNLTSKVLATETSIKNVPTFSSHLIIPKLSIDAKIQDVGITTKGNVSTPNNFFDVGLYKYGTAPGDSGVAIIDGHVTDGLGFNAVFGSLKNIKVGDDIYVEVKKGTKVHFVVTNTDVYDYNSSTKDIFQSSDNKSYLKLITCSGTWIPEIHTHNKRLIVTAVKSDL